MDIVIFGTGSFGEIARLYFSQDSSHRVVAFTATDAYRTSDTFDDLPLVPFETVEETYPPESFGMFVAVGYRGMNEIRARHFAEAQAKGYDLVSYVSSRCTIWPDLTIGKNTFIFEDNTIQPRAKIGDDVVLWSGNHIGHHSVIGDHTFIASHAVVSGHVRVGRKCFIGVNATLKDGISVGDSCFIGPGALILKSAAGREVFLADRTKAHVLDSTQIGF